MLKHLKYFLIILIFSSSCGKKLIYFQKKEKSANTYEQISLSNAPDISQHLFTEGDIISIEFTSQNKELVDLFKVDIKSTGTNDNQMGYMVQTDGNIFLPIIGNIKVAGLTSKQSEELISTEINKYFNNTKLSVKFKSFRISMMGEVKQPTNYQSIGDKMTILQALSMAGDLTSDAKKSNIKVIRQINQTKKTIFLDLTDIDIFKSEAYYLQSNDIVYVESNSNKIIRENLTYVNLMVSLINVVNIIILSTK